ncbi:MAG: hypothetical protein JWO05_279 [Gemmatimonadetes bacterium]|nr:hypothetical protein [Gemmatimonadota bacterium]
MAGQHRPADHSKGDANTIGGYRAVHDRPATFEGSDGMSYSVELMVDPSEDEAYDGYLLFVRWARIGAASPEGHIESPYLVRGASEEEALARLGSLPLSAVHEQLEELIMMGRSPGARGTRRWFDVMKDEKDESE